ncbi:HAD-IIIC family phosphatase [Azospirillum sp.]|uniref:HAD-IIIC family phosphatase n=1 Tax=Azospirillum sp. TaxID=34012 RepID=UPI003D7203B8
MAGDDSLPPPTAPTLRVYLAGNATLRPMAAGVREGALAAGVVATVADAPANQFGPLFFDPGSDFYTGGWDVAVLVLSSLGLTSAGTTLRDGVADDLAAVAAAIRSRSEARIAVVLPEPLEEEWDPDAPVAAWRAGVVADIRAALDDRVLVIDPLPTLLEVGAAAWYAPRFWYHAKLPCHPTALAALGRGIGRSLAAGTVRTVKLVACDLDNLLWGGIVGEDGCHGLALDVHGGGGPFIRLQAYLKHLASRGLVLAAVSKNNPEDVQAVFRERREMLLGWDDFACVCANWEPKSANLRAVAAELNLGLASVAFLDDSPFERAEVRAALPEVTVPELPTVPEEYVPFLVRSGLFATPFATGEDRDRQRHYRENRARREAAQGAPDLAGFLDSLDLSAEMLPIDAATIERAVQLIAKTNQFNLTGRRHALAAVRAMADAPGGFARCCRVADRFGDNGITGVLIAVPEGQSSCRIDTWVLSCRVMGRAVERAMFATLVDWAAARGVRWIVGEHVPSDRNQPVAGLYPDLGFERTGSGLYRYDTAVPYAGNRHVRVLSEAS